MYLYVGESNGNLTPRNCLECSVPEPYRSPDWALVPAKPAFGLNTNDDDEGSVLCCISFLFAAICYLLITRLMFFNIVFKFVFLFCIFVFYFAYFVCFFIVLYIAFPFYVAISFPFFTSLPTTAIGWKTNCSK